MKALKAGWFLLHCQEETGAESRIQIQWEMARIRRVVDGNRGYLGKHKVCGL